MVLFCQTAGSNPKICKIIPFFKNASFFYFSLLNDTVMTAETIGLFVCVDILLNIPYFLLRFYYDAYVAIIF